jgi:NAD(P)-dependent dehydrogenase (short-subunit alcohol dehydrogenase family)
MMNIDEVTSCFEFLLNENSSYVTGTEIKVDGGWTAW